MLYIGTPVYAALSGTLENRTPSTSKEVFLRRIKQFGRANELRFAAFSSRARVVATPFSITCARVCAYEYVSSRERAYLPGSVALSSSSRATAPSDYYDLC